MPQIPTGKLSLEQIAKGAITRGEIQIANGFEWSGLTIDSWNTFTDLELTIDIPDNTRALLLTNHLTLRTFFNGGVTRTFYSRMNLDNGRWISPEMTITVENKSGSWGSSAKNIEDTGTNMYLMKDSHPNWKTGQVTINVELQCDYNMTEHDMNSDGILTAAMLLR